MVAEKLKGMFKKHLWLLGHIFTEETSGIEVLYICYSTSIKISVNISMDILHVDVLEIYIIIIQILIFLCIVMRSMTFCDYFEI